jgi:outer membrane protein OmpA-like peptidoglycan-associated protein
VANRKIPLRQLLNKPIDVPTGDPLVIVVPKLTRSIVEMEDVNFHFDSPVLLPDPKCDGRPDTPGQDRITGLAVLRACYLFARDHTGQKVVIAGHTDTTGDAAYNLTLSKMRADGVLHVLTGKRKEWAKLCNSKYRVEDYQHILKWIATTFGWSCDPTDVDNRDGPMTRRAVLGFQKRYNVEFDANIAEDGAIGEETWGAIFDVYMLELKELLGTDDAGLDDLRGKLQFLEDGRKTVGCGENHPIPGAHGDRPGTKESESKVGPTQAEPTDDDGADDFRSVTNRRVEILFFESGHEPKLDCHPSAGKCNPKLCEIYNGDHFDFEHVPCPPRQPKPLEAFWSVVVDPDADLDGVALVVSDDAGQELKRLPADGAESGPGDSKMFDLSEFDPTTPLVLELRDKDDHVLAPAQRLLIQDLRQTLASDGSSAADALALVGDRVTGAPLDGQDDQIGIQISQNAVAVNVSEPPDPNTATGLT